MGFPAVRRLALVVAAAALHTVTAAVEPAPPAAASVFISGHSLTDRPMPDSLAAIAGSLGTTLQWNRQYLVGSTIRERSRGLVDGETGWPGYRHGLNRDGEGLDVIAELRAPRTIGPGARYDLLLITEQNGLLGAMMWHDTVRYLRHYHERFIAGNADGQTWFYEPWMPISSRDDPSRWLAFERHASPLWQCVVTRVNLALAAEGRRDRIASLPASSALGELVRRATQAPGVPGLSGGSTRATVDRLFHDDVHLTPLGSYYMALVSYAAMFKRSPVGAWAPAGVSAEQAGALQRIAGEFMASYRAGNRPLDLGQCRARLQDGFITEFWTYVRDTTEPSMSPLRAEFRRYKRQWHWQRTVRREDADNPFWFDPATDRDYWLPAPPP